ncbi:hypothetical protein CHUAL_004309 [Chamberlinius hualienensis]
MEGDQSIDHLGGSSHQNSLPERLRIREEARLDKILKETKVEIKKEKKDFENDFQQSVSHIRLQLDNIEKLQPDKKLLSAEFEKIRDDLQSLQKLVADATTFLATYDKRVANDTLSVLQEEILGKEASLLPKKKFAFKSRKKDVNKQLPVEKVPQAQASFKLCELVSMTISLCDAENVTLTKIPEEVNGKDVEICRLKNCTVYIYGYPSTVHITGLKDCDIFLGPVSTSVFVDECESVKFNLACQQLRVHNSRNVNFYVHITSRSIIEECSGIKFAKYCWNYDKLDEHFQSSGLDQNINHWNLVDDFNWLSSDVPSPNWSLLENAELSLTD